VCRSAAVPSSNNKVTLTSASGTRHDSRRAGTGQQSADPRRIE
jgi:hypothetical protein